MTKLLQEHYLGWHWLNSDRCLQHSIPRRQLDHGSVVEIESVVVLNRQGLHWSNWAIDALVYAPGPVLCRVGTWGQTVHSGKTARTSDRSVSRVRKILWWVNAEKVLWAWLCDVAEDALLRTELNSAPAWAAINLRRKWLDGEAVQDHEWTITKNVIRDAAWAATRAAPVDVALGPARDATWAAFRTVFQDVHKASVHAAYKGAFRHPSWDIGRDAQNERLEALLRVEAQRFGVERWSR